MIRKSLITTLALLLCLLSASCIRDPFKDIKSSDPAVSNRAADEIVKIGAPAVDKPHHHAKRVANSRTT